MGKWNFPSNNYGEEKGINDSGVATFRGTPLISLAREICQNSLDAARDKTVRIDFNAFRIKKENLPGHDILQNVFVRCKDFWRMQKSKTTQDFFDKAIKMISEDEISVLRISDFSTTGLLGSREERNTDWTNLTKSSGVSDKHSAAGGSFGIGKYAPFACSDFSTVFYSTYDQEDYKASQGVSRLVTFKGDDGVPTSGVGYYGNEKNTPVLDQLNFDETFSRVDGEYGTDIFVVGYKFHNDQWADDIVISVLDGFFGAIWREKLIVNVGNIEISKATLESLIEEYSDQLTGYVTNYYEVLKSKKTHWITEDFMGLGDIKLGLLFPEQEMHRKVAMIRKTGMKILDRDRLSGYINFAGVMFIDGENLNKELRQIENPEHNAWQPERSPNVQRSEEIVKSLNAFIRDKIEKITEDVATDAMDPFGLGALLPDEAEEDCPKTEKEEDLKDEIVKIEKKVIERKQRKEKKNGEKEKEEKIEPILGEEDVDWCHNGEPNPIPFPDPKPSTPVDYIPTDEKTTPILEKLTLSKCIFIEKNKDNGEYYILLQADELSPDSIVEITLSGETQSFEAPLLSAKDLKGNSFAIEDNKILGICIQKDTSIRLIIKIDYTEYCALEVACYAVKK